MTRPAKPASVITLFLALAAFPAGTLEASSGKYAGEFMAIGVGGRSLALGGAYVALANDVTAGYWNPAGLSRLSYPQLGLMHDERFAGLVNYDYGAAAMPLGPSSTIGLSVIRLGVDNIPDTRNAGVDAEGNPLPPDRWEEFIGIDPSRVVWYNSADWAFYFSYAKKASGSFSYGANIKFISRDNGGASATGIGFDLGALYTIDRLSLGANLQDATTTLVAWSTGTNEFIIPTLKLGGAYRFEISDVRIIPVADADVRFENRGASANLSTGPVSFDFHGGLEFSFREIAALRAGYTDIGSLTFGAGVKLPKIDLDYSYSKFDDSDQLGNTHRISILFTLEAERFLRPGS
jgi:hypothetical protein